MALCERCQAEIVSPRYKLPPPWFDHDEHLIDRQYVPPILWQLLEILWRRRGHMVTRESLMTVLYGHESEPPKDFIITIYVCQLRRLLSPTPFVIETEWKRGYRLNERVE